MENEKGGWFMDVSSTPLIDKHNCTNLAYGDVAIHSEIMKKTQTMKQRKVKDVFSPHIHGTKKAKKKRKLS